MHASYLLFCSFFAIVSVKYDCGSILMVNFLIVGKGIATLSEQLSNETDGEEKYQLAKAHESDSDDCMSKNKKDCLLDDIPVHASSLMLEIVFLLQFMEKSPLGIL